MRRSTQPPRGFLFIAAVVLAACGSANSDGPSSGGTGGAAGSGGMSADPLCTQACQVVLTCDSNADDEACKSQCNDELSGKGYLVPEIAKDYYQLFVNAGSDPACNYTKHQVAWQHWTLDIANIDQLAEPAVLDECIDKYTERWGPPQLSTNGHRDFCFMGFYRYNLSTRNSIRECFSLQCDKDALGCIDGKYINGEPWLAGVAQQ